MADFTKPNPVRESTDSLRSIALLLLLTAGLFFGLRDLPPTLTPHVFSHTAKQSAPTSPASMNLIERPLFSALTFVQSRLVANRPGSWGWAIILLTLAINLLLLPTRIASMRSGVKMQRIQPQITAIKSRYTGIKLTDPRHTQMTAEIAALQKEHGINIFGGCLPLLLQMPLLLAFFGMLRKAPPLHGAGWLWLHDLSASDPYHVLPILMVVFQLLVQWSTPSPGADASQQKITACVMTIGFGYVSWHYAAGVALYALTGSLFSLVTQAAMNRTSGGREMKALSNSTRHATLKKVSMEEGDRRK